MAILKKEKEPNIFSLCSIQAIIKKDKEKRMTKDEHELILGAVKRNIENEFDIIIQKAYFFYVLSKKNGNIEDEETKKDCEENKIQYIGFDLNSINEKENNSDKYIVDLKKGFITESFPNINCSSLLFNNFEKDNISFLALKKIIDDNLIDAIEFDIPNYFSNISEILKNIIPSNKNSDILINQLKYFQLSITSDIRNIITECLTDFCFLIVKCNKKSGENIYLYFNKSAFDLENKTIMDSFRIPKECKNALFCFSTIPLTFKRQYEF